MTRTQSSIVFFCSILVLIISAIWLYRETSYEPAIGVAAAIGGIAASYWPWKPRRYLTPEQKIAGRDKWRPIFQDYFLERARDNGRLGDAIIHDVNRLDHYPNGPEGKGISSWFRAGLMGTYNRGILLGLRWTYVIETDGKLKESSSGSDDNKVMLLGEVPFELIESVNFDGDSYYNKPHIFCHFDISGQPYERLFFGQQRSLLHGHYFYTDVLEYTPPPKWRRRFPRLAKMKFLSKD